jgi:hypothetical protein
MLDPYRAIGDNLPMDVVETMPPLVIADEWTEALPPRGRG